MRDPDRITDVLCEIERLWRLHPDWRLGQLVANVAEWANESPWDIEEDMLVAEIQRHISQQSDAVQSKN